MPPIEELGRQQKAVLWNRTGYSKFNEPELGSPEEIKVRWDDVRRESIDSRGTPIVIDADVVVNQEVPIGSLLWLGSLDDWSISCTADNNNVMQVIGKKSTVDLKNIGIYYRTLSLVRRHGESPS